MEVQNLELAAVLLLCLSLLEQQEFVATQASQQLFRCQSSSEQSGRLFTPNISDMYFNHTSTAAMPIRLGVTAPSVTYVFTIPPESDSRNCTGNVLSMEYCYGYKGQFGRTVMNAFHFLILSKQGREATINESFSIDTTPSESICSSKDASIRVGRVCCDEVTRDFIELQSEALTFGVIVNEETNLLTFHSTVAEFQFEQYQVSSQSTTLGDTVLLEEASKLTSPFLFLRFFIGTATTSTNAVPTTATTSRVPTTTATTATTTMAPTTTPTTATTTMAPTTTTTTATTTMAPTTSASTNSAPITTTVPTSNAPITTTVPTNTAAPTMKLLTMNSMDTKSSPTTVTSKATAPTKTTTDYTSDDSVTSTTSINNESGAVSPSSGITTCVNISTVTSIDDSSDCNCATMTAITDGLVGAAAVSTALNVVLIITSLSLLLLLVKARKKFATVEDTPKDSASVTQDQQQQQQVLHTISNPSYGTSQDYEIPIRTVQQ